MHQNNGNILEANYMTLVILPVSCRKEISYCLIRITTMCYTVIQGCLPELMA